MIPSKLIEIEVPKATEKDVVLDKKGFFVINVDKKSIIVEYYERVEREGKKVGGKLKLIFKGTRARDLYRAILKHDLISMLDHAAYLGLELGKAEFCLKKGKKYVQDAEI